MDGNATDQHHLPLLITAGVVALVLLWPCVRSGPMAPRLVAEVANHRAALGTAGGRAAPAVVSVEPAICAPTLKSN